MLISKILYLQEALRYNKIGPEPLRAIQSKKLINIIRYSYRRVPYYRNLWKKIGLNPQSIKNTKDVKKLPTISKRIVLQNYDSFISDEYRKYLGTFYRMGSTLYMRSTSGTSGIPFKIYFNPYAKNYLDAVYARALLNVDYNPMKPLLYYWWQQTKQKELYHLFGLFKKIYVPCAWDEERQLSFMQEVKPEYIYYYPSALYFISRLILNEGIELDFRPKLIISHAEILTENMRKNIENAFDTNVYDQYGSNEFNRIAWECKERNGYHADTDSVLVEIVDKNYDEVSPGETGKVLITGLVNKAIPLIRYEIGDFAIKADEDQLNHSCGTSLPVVIKSIEGRYEHSEIKKDRVITQKSFLNRILNFLDKEQNLLKLQIFMNSRNRKMIVNYVTFGDKSLEKNYGKIKLNKYSVLFKKVKNVKKNEITGKILLLEKI